MVVDTDQGRQTFTGATVNRPEPATVFPGMSLSCARHVAVTEPLTVLPDAFDTGSGVAPFHCTIHPHLHGTLVVR